MLAARQWGVLSRAQLFDCGLSATGLKRWLAAGHIHGLHPGVYALGHTRIPIEGRLVAALLHAGPGAALSHTSAAWWWRLVKTPPQTIDVSAPCGARSTEGVCVHHPRLLQRTRHRRFPVTPVSRTLRDIALQMPFAELRLAVAEAEFLRLFDLELVYRTLGRGRPGAAKLRRALDAHLPELGRTRNEFEARLVFLCEQAGLPLPEVNAPVCGYEVDAVWRDAGLVVELDGRDAHAPGARMYADRERDLRLRSAGYTVHRYTWPQLTGRRAEVLSDLRRALGLTRAESHPSRR
jgi:very-short-patch-repair endonuclease